MLMTDRDGKATQLRLSAPPGYDAFDSAVCYAGYAVSGDAWLVAQRVGKAHNRRALAVERADEHLAC